MPTGDADPQLSHTDREVLALAGEGRPHAEIAVRLGLSTGEVRERIARLRGAGAPPHDVVLTPGTLHPPGHHPLDPGAGPLSPPPADGRRALAPLATVAVAVLVVVLYLVSADGDGGGSAPVRKAVAPSAVATASAPHDTSSIILEDPRGFIWPAIVVSRQAFLVLGSLINADDIRSVEIRETLAVVSVTNPARLSIPDSPVQWKFQNTSITGPTRGRGLALAGAFQGSNMVLVIEGATPTTYLSYAPGDPAVSVHDDSGADAPRILVHMTYVGLTGTSELRHINLDPLGRLMMAFGPPSGELAIDYRTGEPIDTSAAEKHSLPGAHGWLNSCAGFVCTATISTARTLVSPVAGDAGCEDGVIVVRAAAYTLTFQRVIVNPALADCSREVPTGPVQAGQPLVAEAPGYDYLVTAEDPDGGPVAVAASSGGNLYVGTLVPTGSCPCLGESEP